MNADLGGSDSDDAAPVAEDDAAFFEAVGAGDVSAVRAALDETPHLIAAMSDAGIRPPLAALYAGHPHLADELAARSGELDVHEATAFDDTGRLRQLIAMDRSCVTEWSADGWQPLQLAALFGRIEAARLLLDEDAPTDVVSRNAAAGTALYLSAQAGHGDLVWLLIGSGADVSLAGPAGCTPLHAAAAVGSADAVQALLSAGASLQARDESGCTAADVATASVRPLLVDGP